MSNPNPNVWGAPSAWVNAEVFPAVGSGNSTIKAVKPKCTQFQAASPWYSRMSLGRGVQVGKITANQPIDNSICTNGQHPVISPFAHIGLFKNKQSSTNNIIPDSVYEETNQINWFFADVNAGSGGLRDHTINTTQANERWSPNADSSNNMNYWTSPLVYYQIKSILLLIKVDVITGYSANGFPTMQTYSLRDWKTSHSDKKIAQIWLQFYGYNQLSGNNLSYTTSDMTLQADQCTTVCIMNSVNNIIDYATYNVDRRCKFYILHALYDNGYDTTTTYYSTAYNMFENQTYHSNYYQSTEGGWNLWSEIPYSDKNYETILKMAALFGCPFTDTSTTTFDINFLSDDLFLPVIPDDGIALGEYTHGVRNVLNSLYDADSVRDLNYNPDTPLTPVDTNTYSLTTGFNVVGSVASTTKQYVINGAGLQGLSGEMWSIMGDLVTTPDDLKNLDNLSLDAFLTNNPIDAIVSVKKFPLDHVPHGETLENVYLGKYQTGAAAYELATQQATYNFKAIPVFPKFGDCFLDYAPYTTMQLFIPFCGTIDINPADFMGRNLSVEMNMDFITGAVTAYVLSGGLVVQTATGNCAIDIPITGTESATVNAALENAILNEKSARGNYIARGSVGGMLTNPVGNISNPSNAVQTRFNTKIQLMKSNYELQHIQEPLRQIGAASPLTGWAIEFVCRLIIYYPDGEIISFNATNEPTLITDKVKAFGDVNGFATVETGTLSNYSGFTVVSEIDLHGITATESELNEIRTLLQSGVYV